jgi:hypothetical protein
MLQSLLVDLELWLTETQATIATEIKLTSVQVVKEQIRASQVSQTKPHTLEIRSYFVPSGSRRHFTNFGIEFV